MSQVLDQMPSSAPVETDLVTAVQRVLAESAEPLTISKIKAALPAPHRRMELEELAELLRRQVAANVLHQFPKYRSSQDRYWDRPMSVHVTALLRATLDEQPLNSSELRRKLPAYAHGQAESILQEQLGQGLLYRHPRVSGRGGERFSTRPADPRDYLPAELSGIFQRLAQLGFSQTQVREAALDILHNEEWAPTQPSAQPSETIAEATGESAVESSVERQDTPTETTDNQPGS